MQTITSSTFPEIGETVTIVHGKMRRVDGTFTNHRVIASQLQLREAMEYHARARYMADYCLTAEEIDRFTAITGGIVPQYQAMIEYCLKNHRIIPNHGGIYATHLTVRAVLLDALKADDELDIAADLFLAKLAESDQKMSAYDVWIKLSDWCYQNGLTVVAYEACGHPVVWREVKDESAGSDSCGAASYWEAICDGVRWTVDDPLSNRQIFVGLLDDDIDYEELFQ